MLFWTYTRYIHHQLKTRVIQNPQSDCFNIFVNIRGYFAAVVGCLAMAGLAFFVKIVSSIGLSFVYFESAVLWHRLYKNQKEQYPCYKLQSHNYAVKFWMAFVIFSITGFIVENIYQRSLQISITAFLISTIMLMQTSLNQLRTRPLALPTVLTRPQIVEQLKQNNSTLEKFEFALWVFRTIRGIIGNLGTVATWYGLKGEKLAWFGFYIYVSNAVETLIEMYELELIENILKSATEPVTASTTTPTFPSANPTPVLNP